MYIYTGIAEYIAFNIMFSNLTTVMKFLITKTKKKKCEINDSVIFLFGTFWNLLESQMYVFFTIKK